MNNQCVHERNVTSNISYHIPLCNHQDEHSVVCYSFWRLVETFDQSYSTSRHFSLHAKGCWGKDRSLCKSKLFNNSLLFCCCDGEFCNRDIDPKHCLEQLNSTIDRAGISFAINIPIISNDLINLICLIILLTVIPIIVFCLFKLLRKKQLTVGKIEERTQLNWTKELEKLLTDHDHIEIIEYKTRGRYGDIFKALLIDDKNTESRTVAIKLFQQADYESFKSELKIFKLPNLKHDNLLGFIKAEVRSGNLLNTTEYWLITEYQENGSLQEFLNHNLLDQKQIVQISLDIANGLAFLHGRSQSNRQIAHRDFKSGNILLDSQLRACIADFGLAFVFYNHKLESDTLNQVGTSRYFSPELLDGAINFSGDSLLKVDIYACALIFWETLSRCAELQNQNTIKTYKLPFELELGIMPTIYELRNFISCQHQRPVIEKHWRSNSFLEEFCRIIEDCWESDAEKRITSACVVERLKLLKR